MATRKAWNRLTPSYRRRLERQGITAQSHRTADLREKRGHKPRRPANAAPLEATRRMVGEEATDQDRRDLREWREHAPAWLPDRYHMADDVAAALSQLRPPSTWKQVRVVAKAQDEGPWTVTVWYRRSPYPQTVEIPNEAGPEVLDLLSRIGRADLGADPTTWEEWINRGRDWDVEST